VRATDFDVIGPEVAAIARGTWKNCELSGWGGSLYEELAVAGSAAGSQAPLRSEAKRW